MVFAPWTTLFYTIAWWGGTAGGGLYFWGYVLVVIGILFDIASHGGGAWRSRKKVPGYAA